MATNCSNCGVLLTNENAYPDRRRKTFRNLCKTCDVKARVIRRGQKFTTRVTTGKIIEFSSLQEKREWVAGRRIQARWGRPRVTPASSSNFGKSSWVLVEEEKDGIKKKFHKMLLCRECGNIVRYDAHNYQVCSKCGLIHNDFLNTIFYETDCHFDKMKKSQRYKNQIAFSVSSFVNPDNIKNCYDAYYSDFYSKNRKRFLKKRVE